MNPSPPHDTPRVAFYSRGWPPGHAPSGIASYVSEGFTRPDGTIIGPVGTPDGGTIVAKVLSHSGADLSQLAAQRSTVRDEIKSQRARERNTLFESGVKDMLIKQGKIKIHQDVITRLIGNYRTS